MKLFQFILGKFLGGLVAIVAMVMMVGVWKLQMLPVDLMRLAIAIVTLLVAVVIALTWSGENGSRKLAGVGIILIGLAAIAMLVSLWLSQTLPTPVLVIIGVIVVTFTALGALLNFFRSGTARMVVGIVLACMSIIAFVAGSFFSWKAVNMVDQLSNVGKETVQVGVYMRADDDRDLDANFKFGVWQPKDSEADAAVNTVISQMNKDLKTTISCTEFETPTELLDALLKGELDAIIINSAYLDVWMEIPGFEEKLSQIKAKILQDVEIESTKDEDAPAKENPEYTSLKDSFAIYISGIDARGGKVTVKSRSDVNIVAVVNPKTRQVLLINTPRDYYVPISSPESYLNGKNDKLTHAGLGGPNASRETLSNLYGIDVSYYFKVNFSGFVEIVDALDGITVYSEYNFGYKDDDGSYYTYQKGDNELNGKEALGFCRNRYSFASGDNQRGKNQMAVIKAVINKALSPKLLTNYTEILNAISGSMEMTVPMDVIGDLVSRQLSEGGEWNVVSYSVTGSGGYAKSPAAGGAEAYMMFPHEESVERAKELIQDVINGKTVTP